MRWWSSAALLLVGCGGGTHAVEDGTSTSTSTGEPSEVGSDHGDDQGTTTGTPEEGQWCGFYDTGFFKVGFEACTGDYFIPTNLPGFEHCRGAPLWLCVRGTLHPDGEGELTLLEVTEILDGPCQEGSCTEDVVPEHCWTCDPDAVEPCDAFAEACEVRYCTPGISDCGWERKCTAFSTEIGACTVDDYKCVLTTGDGKVGDPCMREAEQDDCEFGLFCLATTSAAVGPGVCRVFCEPGDPDACAELGPPAAGCAQPAGGSLSLCVEPCDPVAQDCPPPLGCYGIGDDGFTCLMPPQDGGGQGEACSCVSNDCQPGSMCFGGARQEACLDESCCTPLCECDPNTPAGVISPACQEGGELCVCYSELYPNAPAGSETAGLCLLPQ